MVFLNSSLYLLELFFVDMCIFLSLSSILSHLSTFLIYIQYGNRNFWARVYFVDTVGKNEKMIATYIKNQLEEDFAKDQITLKEFADPFTGVRNKYGKNKQPLLSGYL